MRVLNRLGGRREKPEVDPAVLKTLLDGMKDGLTKIMLIESDAERLHRTVDDFDQEEPDSEARRVSMHGIIDSGKANKIMGVNAEFFLITGRVTLCKGVEVTVRAKSGKAEDAEAYDGGSGNGFTLEDGDVITGTIEGADLEKGGRLFLENTKTSRWPDQTQSPYSSFKVHNIFSTYDGNLAPNITMELAEQ